MEKVFHSLKSPLERINELRDKLLFRFIKPWWPRSITPNYITVVRMAIAIQLFVLLFFLKIDDKVLIVSLFIFGALTDALDGSVARGLGQTSALGALLDPLADRLLIIPIMVYGLYDSHFWLLLLLIAAELANGLLYFWTRRTETQFKPHIFAKTKIVFLCLGLLAILVFWPYTPPIALYCFKIGILFSLLTIFAKIYETRHSNI